MGIPFCLDQDPGRESRFQLRIWIGRTTPSTGGVSSCQQHGEETESCAWSSPSGPSHRGTGLDERRRWLDAAATAAAAADADTDDVGDVDYMPSYHLMPGEDK